MTEKRIRLSRKKGYRKPKDAVNVARPSKWGNPFDWREIGKEKAKQRYEQWLCGVIDNHRIQRQWVLAHIHELRGKDLACWCKPNEPCHADVLIKMASDDDFLEWSGG